ncbi:AAA family ATPase [Chitinophaga sancti]|uniref:AAA domain-containing protein, putative AbiEii toxin, Type IV TA system n=1 Tax=Chitinophaga sancti TaxID=1004 RepID=A0A1K1SZV7_9BACT|nr:ATP-binding protein [Chitinophaga sancti]WQD63648.1 ATP-binding protein [Chitinophaga sancti]WQG90727.1 ATP-binding protein [Chitinophaga sancti]SFW89615.1 AAA domain-containing protein, putative AbiEii toxin, Type IV TA system [Chitinophaga sancti]
MLVYFKVENYRSIKEPVVINFTATSLSEHQDSNLIDAKKSKLLKSVLLYGPNASGKSKIIEAFITYRNLILESAGYNSTNTIDSIVPFRLNSSTLNAPSSFEAAFIIKEKRYRYGFEASRNAVAKEWLFEVKATTETALFLRIGQQFEIAHKKFPNAEGLETRSKPNVLFLSVADLWNAPVANEIYKWFNEIHIVHGLLDQSHKKLTNDLLKIDHYKQIINSIIQQADLGIKGVEVVQFSDDDKATIMKKAPGKFKTEEYLSEFFEDLVFTIHEVFDENGNPVRFEPFEMELDESEGTKKFYNILGTLISAIEKGQLVVIDELDARLHSLMTKAIIRLFNSETANSGSQLFAVSHDVSVVDRDLLRRDQVYIVEKDRIAATKVVNLAEYKIVRKDTPFSKNYLEGKYGGIPFIENLENSFKDDEQ